MYGLELYLIHMDFIAHPELAWGIPFFQERGLLLHILLPPYGTYFLYDLEQELYFMFGYHPDIQSMMKAIYPYIDFPDPQFIGNDLIFNAVKGFYPDPVLGDYSNYGCPNIRLWDARRALHRFIFDVVQLKAQGFDVKLFSAKYCEVLGVVPKKMAIQMAKEENKLFWDFVLDTASHFKAK